MVRGSRDDSEAAGGNVWSCVSVTSHPSTVPVAAAYISPNAARSCSCASFAVLCAAAGARAVSSADSAFRASAAATSDAAVTSAAWCTRTRSRRMTKLGQPRHRLRRRLRRRRHSATLRRLDGFEVLEHVFRDAHQALSSRCPGVVRHDSFCAASRLSTVCFVSPPRAAPPPPPPAPPPPPPSPPARRSLRATCLPPR